MPPQRWLPAVLVFVGQVKRGPAGAFYFLTQTGGLVWVRSGRNSAWTIARAASQEACELNSWKATPVSGVGTVPVVGLADMKKAINMYMVKTL
jgi:hypothetical protein